MQKASVLRCFLRVVVIRLNLCNNSQHRRNTAPNDWKAQNMARHASTENAVKQTTRLKKVLCEVDGYIARISRSTLITYGSPICPACNQSMKEAR